jgi:hypothetical protein
MTASMTGGNACTGRCVMSIAEVTTQRAMPDLIREVNDLHERIMQTKAKTGDLEITLGLMLAEAKDRKPKGTTWPVFAKKHFKFSQQRADELIRIATGKTTVEKVRETKRESMKKTRKKSTPRGVGSNVVPIKPKPDPKREQEARDEKVGRFHHELMNFIDGFCGHLQQWAADHPNRRRRKSETARNRVSAACIGPNERAGSVISVAKVYGQRASLAGIGIEAISELGRPINAGGGPRRGRAPHRRWRTGQRRDKLFCGGRVFIGSAQCKVSPLRAAPRRDDHACVRSRVTMMAAREPQCVHRSFGGRSRNTVT